MSKMNGIRDKAVAAKSLGNVGRDGNDERANGVLEDSK